MNNSMPLHLDAITTWKSTAEALSHLQLPGALPQRGLSLPTQPWQRPEDKFEPVSLSSSGSGAPKVGPGRVRNDNDVPRPNAPAPNSMPVAHSLMEYLGNGQGVPKGAVSLIHKAFVARVVGALMMYAPDGADRTEWESLCTLVAKKWIANRKLTRTQNEILTGDVDRGYKYLSQCLLRKYTQLKALNLPASSFNLAFTRHPITTVETLLTDSHRSDLVAALKQATPLKAKQKMKAAQDAAHEYVLQILSGKTRSDDDTLPEALAARVTHTVAIRGIEGKTAGTQAAKFLLAAYVAALTLARNDKHAAVRSIAISIAHAVLDHGMMGAEDGATCAKEIIAAYVRARAILIHSENAKAKHYAESHAQRIAKNGTRGAAAGEAAAREILAKAT